MAKSRCLADPFTIIFNNTHSHRLALDPAVCPVCSVRNTQAGSEFFQPGLCRFPPLCAFLNRCLWLPLTAFRPLARRPADPWSCLACPPPPLCYTSLSLSTFLLSCALSPKAGRLIVLLLCAPHPSAAPPLILSPLLAIPEDRQLSPNPPPRVDRLVKELINLRTRRFPSGSLKPLTGWPEFHL
jgi:hypothetical protein